MLVRISSPARTYIRAYNLGCLRDCLLKKKIKICFPLTLPHTLSQKLSYFNEKTDKEGIRRAKRTRRVYLLLSDMKQKENGNKAHRNRKCAKIK